MNARLSGLSNECNTNLVNLLAVPDASNKMTAPTFEKALANLEVSEGQKLELECVVVGDPEPKVTWMKDGSVVSSSEALEVKYKNGVAKLIINAVAAQDAGTYVCQAKNTAGKVDTQCQLKVNGKCNWGSLSLSLQTAFKFNVTFSYNTACFAENKSKSTKAEAQFWPKIVEHIESRYVNDGEAVVLSCKIECGDNNGSETSSFDVVWLHNNKEIKPSKDFQYARDGNVYKLQIAEIFPEDSGTYTCEAFNNAGAFAGSFGNYRPKLSYSPLSLLTPFRRVLQYVYFECACAGGDLRPALLYGPAQVGDRR